MEEPFIETGKTGGANLNGDHRFGFGMFSVEWDILVKVSVGTWSLQVRSSGGRTELQIQER